MAVALALEYRGLDVFSNIFLTILQVIIVFLIQVFFLNTWLERQKRNANRPELLKAFDFLKQNYRAYSKEVDIVCEQAGIQRQDIFYYLDKLYNKLKIQDKPTSAGGI